MQRITNKTKKKFSLDPFAKHPGKFLKRDTSSRLRQNGKKVIALDSLLVVPTHSPIDKRAQRKRTGHCPICIFKLMKNKKGTRYAYSCEQCKAQLKPDIRCPSCNTNRVWGGKDEMRCKGCGKSVEA
jgi:endogenous inhibitor of DNA gyrase (YacG/DUF329 family)